MICDSMCIKLVLYFPASGPPSKIVMILMKQDFYDDSSDSRGQDHSRTSRIIMIQCIVIFPCKYVTVIHLFFEMQMGYVIRNIAFIHFLQDLPRKRIESYRNRICRIEVFVHNSIPSQRLGVMCKEGGRYTWSASFCV